MTTKLTDSECGATASASNPDDLAGTEFRFWITPHRSMADRRFAVFLFATINVAIVDQLAFLALGAWMAGFGNLFDGLFLAAAFVACRADRRRVETIAFRNGILRSERRRGNGEFIALSEVQALGLELIRTQDHDFGLQKLECRHRSTIVEIGTELSPVERQSLADAFEASLITHGFRLRLSERMLALSKTHSVEFERC